MNNTSKFSSKHTLLALALALFGTAGYSADSTQPTVVAATTTSVSPNTSSTAAQTLPNAYELVKKIDSQKLEIARLAGQIEKLELELNQMQRFIDSDLKSLISTEVNSALSAQNKNNSTNAATAQPPYLTPSNANTKANAANTNSLTSNGNRQTGVSLDQPYPKKSASENPLSKPSATKEGAFAYAAAHYSFKNDGSDIGIQKMQDFIATYPKHNLIPNAHYWLGEFYLQQTPPNKTLAKKQFEKVVQDFKNHPENDMQPKALYRLAVMAKENNQSSQAKKYAETLIKNHSDSNEANLAKSIKW